MNKNIEFLNYIYQNARMGIIGINSIRPQIVDEDLKKEIEEQYHDYEAICEQYHDYEAICEEAINLFISYGKEEKDVGLMTKISTYMMASMTKSKDNSTTKIAKMMMQGSNQGIIEITEKLNHYARSDENIVNLAKRLLKVEQKNLDNLKKYL